MCLVLETHPTITVGGSNSTKGFGRSRTLRDFYSFKKKVFSGILWSKFLLQNALSMAENVH